MSKFHTTIPTHIEDILKSLPEGSHVHGITVGADKKTIVLSWENDHWRTPYSVPMEVTPEALAGNDELPEFVKLPAKTPAKPKKPAKAAAEPEQGDDAPVETEQEKTGENTGDITKDAAECKRVQNGGVAPKAKGKANKA